MEARDKVFSWNFEECHRGFSVGMALCCCDQGRCIRRFDPGRVSHFSDGDKELKHLYVEVLGHMKDPCHCVISMVESTAKQPSLKYFRLTLLRVGVH